MPDSGFLDSNVLIYLYSIDEPDKKEISEKLINNTDSVISIQVINEISNVLIRKFHVKAINVLQVIDEISDCCHVEQINIETIKQALQIVKRYKYSYFDSLIISSALNATCKVLYSEDLQHNQNIDNSLLIKNPFKL